MNASPLPAVHFTDHYLLHPDNPVSVNLIGAGGTGSQMLTCLARMHSALLALGHPGLMVSVYDDDRVSPANLGRQLFSEAETGLYKCAALVQRLNRFFGTNWKAVPQKFGRGSLEDFDNEGRANLFVTCVDTPAARFGVADILESYKGRHGYERSRPLYWMDLGNSRDTGQVLLSTVGTLRQPASEKFHPVGNLPFVTETFKNLLESADTNDDTPSCSLAEALSRQDLFINSTLAHMGASLLWSLLHEGMLFNRGLFLNLQDFRTQPLKVTSG